ncbi:hypothetical protein EW146_g5368 [Bondarzewia mesenterica]|uniref:Cyclase n=1 Tax=Bondarzewia mesenterica TaxID=1095465 RepID=A0A4S4LST5_9AGAM|nr:hypothetical protein EW146_g5368 [Bondarzewia mesenterica]
MPPVKAIIDLSHPLSISGGSYCSDHPHYSCERVCSIAADGSNVSLLSLGSHTGTHIDAPVHFIEGGASVSELELSALIGPAVIIDVRGKKPRDVITWEDISPYEDMMVPGVMVLFCTGWSKHWGQEDYPASPRLDVDAARKIVDQGVRVIGIDALSPDGIVPKGEKATHEVHIEILGRGGIIAENLNNLDVLLEAKHPVVSLLPLRLDGCDGSPIRAVAWTNEGERDGH